MDDRKSIILYLRSNDPSVTNDAQELQRDLSEIFKKMKIDMSLNLDGERPCISFRYGLKEVKEYVNRRAGRPEKETGGITIDEIQQRIANGETAASIAQELGISRTSLFRKIKQVKEAQVAGWNDNTLDSLYLYKKYGPDNG